MPLSALKTSYGSVRRTSTVSIHKLRFTTILLLAIWASIRMDVGHARTIPADMSSGAPRSPTDIGQTERSAADQSGDGTECSTTGSKGVWGQYSAQDLPRGHCSATDA